MKDSQEDEPTMPDSLADRIVSILDSATDLELRTVRGLAAILKVDQKDVMLALFELERAGRVLGRRKDMLKVWQTRNTPPARPGYDQKKRTG